MVNRSDKELFLKTVAEMDLAFSEGRAHDLSMFFTQDAQLMWPLTEDIVGRESIKKAFEQFMTLFTTNSWEPNRELLDIYEDRAYSLGSFIELMTERNGGKTVKVFGRLVEVWQLTEGGKWRLIRQMTSRYAEPKEVQVL